MNIRVHRPIALLLLASACLGSPCAAEDGPGARFELESKYTVEGGGASSLELGASAGEFKARLWTAGLGPAPSGEAKGSIELPFLVAGAVAPVGLAAFVRRPTSAGPILIDRLDRPLRMERPDGAPWAGAGLGGALGAMAVSPFSDPSLSAACAWLSPHGGRLSALAGLSDLPATAGGPAWSDAPEPAARRAWSALAVSAGGPGWNAAAAGAAQAGFPGQDSAALRAEGSIAGAGARVEAEAAATFGAWRGLTGEAADAFRADAEARLARRGSAVGAGARLALDAWDGSAELSIRGAAEAEGPLGGARARLDLGLRGVEPASLELSTSFRPAFARWLRLSTGWRASGLEAERFDIEAGLRLSGPLAVDLDAGLRFVPEGILAKLGLGLKARLGSLALGVRVGTDGWAEPSGLGWEGLEYGASARYGAKATPSLYRRRVSRYSLDAGDSDGIGPPGDPPFERRDD